MTEAEWLACTWPQLMLNFVNLKMSNRRKRLFAVACCRLIVHLLPDEHHQNAIRVAEDFADGFASDEQRLATIVAAYDAESYPSAAHAALADIASEAANQACFYAGCAVAAEVNEERRLIELAHQAFILRDIFNPFRPSAPPPTAVLAWNDGTVRRLAATIYEDRNMPEGTLDTGRLSILADALLDAGCDDEELLAHCRSAGPHVRGCWAVDAILGKS